MLKNSYYFKKNKHVDCLDQESEFDNIEKYKIVKK
jgi:hypothetical protein